MYPKIIGQPALRDVMAIAYNGGVDPESLTTVHLRSASPELIIYHHTARDSRISFDELVRSVLQRKDSHGNRWRTGYNCVIMPSGDACSFCRWDRYGNHAQGLNKRSLGLAFHGNFEPGTSVPGANAAGRYGPITPTAVQLDSGARVIALWCFLYQIRPDFKNAIIPHNKIAKTACPGSGFPHIELKKLIRSYFDQWSASLKIQRQIREFAKFPYLFP